MLCRADLLKIVDLVRGELTKLQRATLGALVVMDVHARDVVTQLADSRTASTGDFAWQAQLRSYWVDDDGTRGRTVEMHMMSAALEFGCAFASSLEAHTNPFLPFMVRSCAWRASVCWHAVRRPHPSG
jgi:hypothetical protein